MFLNVLTLLACAQSVDNLFHTLVVLWEKDYVLTSNLVRSFTRPLVSLPGQLIKSLAVFLQIHTQRVPALVVVNVMGEQI